jgi:ribosome recycling factor
MTRMDKAVNSVKMNFSTIRTGRATPNMLDRIEVEYYGAMTPIKSVAGISTPDASTLSIQPFDQSAMAAIERAIMTSDLDLTPNNDGKVIRIRIPALTEVLAHRPQWNDQRGTAVDHSLPYAVAYHAMPLMPAD